MFRILVLALSLASDPAFSQPRGNLENPRDGGYSSGIYLFSGWVCEAEVVEIYLDTGVRSDFVKAAYGTERNDTVGVCGDSDNGFGLLFNMAALTADSETILAIAYADGQEFDRATFNVKRMSSGEFLRGAEALSIEYNFPSEGREVWLEWSESAQNFLITTERDTPDPLDIGGGWVNDATGAGALITTSRFYESRQEVWVMLAVDGENWNLYEGYIKGTRARLRTVAPYGPDADVTIDFADTTNGTITINSCFAANGFDCWVSAGETYAIRKKVGNAAGRASPLFDDEPLVPIGGTPSGSN